MSLPKQEIPAQQEAQCLDAPCPVRPKKLASVAQLNSVYMYNVSPLSPCSWFGFIYCEMRALNPGLVTATGWYLLWASRTQGVIATNAHDTAGTGGSTPFEPFNIGLSPSILTQDNPYTVTWDGCLLSCSILAVSLVEIKTDVTETQTSSVQPATTTNCTSTIPPNVGQPFSCATGFASRLTSSSTYELQILWTNPIDGTAINTASGLPLPVNSDPAQTTSVNTELTSPSDTLKLPPLTIIPSASSTPSSMPSSSTQATIITNTSTGTTSSGLSAGAKAGIAIGAVGFALLVLIVALLLWRRNKQRQLRTLPDRMPYSHDLGSTNRDLAAEKEMHIINSPVDTLHTGYSNILPVTQTHTGSWTAPDEPAAAGAVATAAPYTDTQRRSYGSGYEDPSTPFQAPTQQPAAVARAIIQRKPVVEPASEPLGGPTHHLREPGMSDEEVARLEEEERRLDEAIAEAERRRQQQS